MITVNANAPKLKPKTKPEDMQKIQELYAYLDEQLAGVEAKMKKYGFEQLVITVDAVENAGKE